MRACTGCASAHKSPLAAITEETCARKCDGVDNDAVAQSTLREGDAVIRDAVESDVREIAEIYGHHVMTGLASFEEAAPPESEMLARMRSVHELGTPYLVAVEGGRVVGYCYASLYRTRSAYRFTLEDSVYIREGHAGRGIGRVLLEELLERCSKGPWKQMIAIIGDSGNAGSIALHRALGFRDAGTLEAVGFKFGRWVDSVLMQRAL